MSPDERYRRALAALSALVRFGVRPGLDAIAQTLAALGHPERRFAALHVAGTNGKGSTAAFAESILRAAGARVGLYTSPHLARFTERIRIDGQEASRADTARWIEAVLAAPGGDALTFFEVATAAAFLGFAEAGVPLAVVECGLGGRLDATNTCAPFATVITRIGLDHVEVLGPTADHIAFEKAGITKPGVPLVCGPVDSGSGSGSGSGAGSGLGPGPRRVIEGRAREVGAPLLLLGHDFSVEVRSEAPGRTVSGTTVVDYEGPGGALVGARLSLAGGFQAENAALALAATAFAPAPLRIEEAARRAGLASACWPARLERIAPDVRVDGAHNPDAAGALAAAVRGEGGLTLLVGMLGDKDADGVLSALAPIASRVVCTQPGSPRALAASVLAARARALVPHVPVEELADPVAALAAARDGRQVLVCGSLYLAGQLRAHVLGEPVDPYVVGDPAAQRR